MSYQQTLELVQKRAANLVAGGEAENVDAAVSKVFEGDPRLYEQYRQESMARSAPRSSAADSSPVSVERTVGQIALEGIAKQLVERGDAKEPTEAMNQAIQLRPDLYQLHAAQVIGKRESKVAAWHPGDDLKKIPAFEKLDAIARKLVEDGKATTYGVALDMATKQRPELYRQYWKEALAAIAAA